MREIRKWFEMLDEAAKQLDKHTGTGARLSLILLDNVAEIAMHEKLRMLFARDSQFSSYMRPGRFSAQVRRKALWGFNEKVQLLVAEPNTLSEDHSRALVVGHTLRNEAYHRGIIRDTIIQEVARTYLGTLCAILPHLWIGRLLLVPGEDINGYLRQFGVDASMIDADVLASVCAHFAEGRCSDVNSLAGVLSTDIIRRLDEVVGGLEYLADGGHERVSAGEVLKNLQFHPKFHEKHTFAQTDEGFREFVKTWNREYAEYIPPVTMETFDRWRREAEAMADIEAPGQALEKYASIDKPFGEIEEAVGQAVYEFDEWVNMQVHDRGL